MSHPLLESHIAFEKLQDKAKELGLTLRFRNGNFTFNDGLGGLYRKDNQETTVLPSIINVSYCSEETIEAMIKMWKFCCDYHLMVKKIDGMEKYSD